MELEVHSYISTQVNWKQHKIRNNPKINKHIRAHDFKFQDWIHWNLKSNSFGLLIDAYLFYFLVFTLFLDLKKLDLSITSHFIQVKASRPILFTIHNYSPALQDFNMLYNIKFGAFREIIISRATSGGRREIELNSGSLPLIPGGLATLHIPYPI